MSFAAKTTARAGEHQPIRRPQPVTAKSGISWFAIGTIATAIVAVPIAMIAITAVENLDFSFTGFNSTLTEDQLIVQAMKTELAKVDVSAEVKTRIGLATETMNAMGKHSPENEQWLKMSAAAVNSPLTKMKIRAAMNSKSGRCAIFMRTNPTASRAQVTSFARHIETVRNSGAEPDRADVDKLRILRASVGCRELLARERRKPNASNGYATMFGRTMKVGTSASQ